MTAQEIASYIESMGATKIKVTDAEVTSCCPVHVENRPSFGVSVAKTGHVFNCYACHARGVLPRLGMLVKGYEWREALADVRQFGEYSMEDAMFHASDVSYEERFVADNDDPVDVSYLQLFEPLNLRAKYYLKGRQVGWNIAVRAGIKRFEGRLIYPWYRGRRLLGFTSRSYIVAEDRYRGMPLFNFKKHHYVYDPRGSTNAGKVKRLYIVEGEIDALRMCSAGYDAVGLSGTEITGDQIAEICRLTDTAVLLLDNDSEGADAAAHLKKMLLRRIMVLEPSILFSEYSDPAESSDPLLKRLLRESNLGVVF